MVTTYILAGYDHNDAFKMSLDQWEKRAKEKGDVVIIRPTNDSEERINNIKPPANIIVEAHGTQEGAIEWVKGSRLPYSTLFKALPREGIQSVTINGCYGESAMGMMDNLPPGTLLQSRVGAKVTGLGGGSSGGMAAEIASYKEITPLSIMLEAIDATDPAYYKLQNQLQIDDIKKDPKRRSTELQTEYNVNNVLPHTIGIGGYPPIIVDLNKKMAELSQQGKEHRMDEKHFNHSIEQVQQHFDLNEGNYTNKASSDLEKALDQKINDVAYKLEKGADINSFSVEEKRIGYALTIAQMYNSGEMNKLTQQAKDNGYQVLLDKFLDGTQMWDSFKKIINSKEEADTNMALHASLMPRPTQGKLSLG